MKSSISIHTAHDLLNCFWPEFREQHGVFFLNRDHFYKLDPFDPEEEMDIGFTRIEAVSNRVHVGHLFQNHAQNPSGWGYDPNHPDFAVLCDVGRRMAQMWCLKLKTDFPQYAFRVYYTEYTEREGPVVRFHRVREGEPNWAEEKNCPDDIATGRLVVFDTRKL